MKNMASKGLLTSISVGVNSDSYVLLSQLLAEGLSPDYATVDIAHGHSVKLANMVAHLKRKFPSTFVIAGAWGFGC